ncbi:bifunctional riboflavin kinase/FMN phosphatase-like isoform X1 [Primulina eburnea]|uniref:bifunctional riboflavin kinase/FMN phosphatase-like isoform X1 n=1 Tax=Primulina eburnea TaxID=1245227 RepID=UPI003C6C5CBA
MENSCPKTRVFAVIFDLDGTLLNTEQLTKDILKNFLAKYGKIQDNEKEKKRLGMTQKESAIAIVNDYDLPLTPEQFTREILPMYYGKWKEAKPLPGAERLMRHLHKHGIQFALASNSLSKNIDGKISHHDGWKERFVTILGSDQVKSGKPSPDIYIEAATRMGVDPLHCLVIEDSLVGVKAGKSAKMKVVAVPSLQIGTDTFSVADSILHSLLEFQPELWGLPQFEDWVGKTLPIEPINLSGIFTDGLFHAYADNSLTVLPDQIWGLYLGWVKFDELKVSKAVISIGWSLGCCNSERKINVSILDGSNHNVYDGKMQLLIVGYLQRSISEDNILILNNLDILDEDKVTADAALSLPAFSHKLCKSFKREDYVVDDFCVESEI